jgi:hypothetical protein
VAAFAEGFSARPETAEGLGAALVPGGMVMLVPAGTGVAAGTAATPAGAPAGDWLGTCGKTQLALFVAESLWSSRGVDLLVWVTATSRASVLAGYAEAAAAVGAGQAGDA